VQRRTLSLITILGSLSGIEQRIRPEALKKGVGFGIPWPDSPRSKELQAALPPASGLPD
jgi:hypothetical protein